ncbi:MAG: hypothetical protein PWP23_1326 [Candidatus Sumerlaeota bacterium]|jgi:hypothetical protein|nr:hypothetical protein [Candidatus Sumerlaeota bacterium]
MSPEAIAGRLRTVGQLHTLKRDFIDKVVILPGTSHIPSPGFPSTDQKDNG